MDVDGTYPHLDESGRPTLRTVAALAKVHVSTVSRVLSRNYPADRPPAAATTMERIRTIASEVGFERNPLAAGLRTSRSGLIGVLVPRLTDLVLSTIYEGIAEAARTHEYQTLVTNTQDDPKLRIEAAEMLLARRVDGLILGDCRVHDDPLLDRLTQRNAPFVLVSRRSEQHPSVTCDDYAGGRIVAAHLLERGHRSVAVIAGDDGASTARDRTAGFVDVFADAGLRAGVRVVQSGFDVSSGRIATEAVLRTDRSVTAVFAVNDFAAIGAIGAARDAGMVAGADIAVVGYNDTPVAAELPVPLTSVASPMHEMGRTAVDALLRALHGEAPGSVRLATRLNIRASSSQPARLDERRRSPADGSA